MNGLRLTPLVIVIVALCAAVFLFTLTMSAGQMNALVAQYGLTPARFDPGSPIAFGSWSDAVAALLGHAFLHAGPFHLLMNMMVFLQAAPFLERKLGAWRFAVLYVASILGGAAGYLLINPSSNQPAIGASGAVCGVFAAYFLAVRPSPRAALADPQVRNAMLTFVGVNVVLVALLPLPIAWEAHLGGFIVGALAYPLLAPRTTAGPWS